MFAYAGSSHQRIRIQANPVKPPVCVHERRLRMEEAQRNLQQSLECVETMTSNSQMKQKHPQSFTKLQLVAELLKKNNTACKNVVLTSVAEMMHEDGQSLRCLPELSPFETYQIEEKAKMYSSSRMSEEPKPALKIPNPARVEAQVVDHTQMRDLGKRSPIMMKMRPRKDKPETSQSKSPQVFRTPSPKKRGVMVGKGGHPSTSNRVAPDRTGQIPPDSLCKEEHTEGSDVFYSDEEESSGQESTMSENKRLEEASRSNEAHWRAVARVSQATKQLIQSGFQSPAPNRPRTTRRVQSRTKSRLQPTGSSARDLSQRRVAGRISVSMSRNPASKYVARVRGNYQSYSEELKQKVIDFALRRGTNGAAEAAEKFGVPVKNIKRWIKNGPVRKKGGRKTQDPKMERELAQWVRKHLRDHRVMPKTKIIKEKAKEMSSHADFKASKGWLEKFLARNHLAEKKRSKEEAPRTFLDTDDLSSVLNQLPEIQPKQEGPLSPMH